MSRGPRTKKKEKPEKVRAEIPRRTLTRKEWEAEGERRFGHDPMNWKFQCPSCLIVTATHEWKEAGAPQGAVAFSCIGRYTGHMDRSMGSKPGPCNYTGGGLFGLNPLTVKFPNGETGEFFEFAPEET